MSDRYDVTVEGDRCNLDERRLVTLLFDAITAYVMPDEFWMDAGWAESGWQDRLYHQPPPPTLHIGKNGHHVLISYDARVWTVVLNDGKLRDQVMLNAAMDLLRQGTLSERGRGAKP